MPGPGSDPRLFLQQAHPCESKGHVGQIIVAPAEVLHSCSLHLFEGVKYVGVQNASWVEVTHRSELSDEIGSLGVFKQDS